MNPAKKTERLVAIIEHIRICASLNEETTTAIYNYLETSETLPIFSTLDAPTTREEHIRPGETIRQAAERWSAEHVANMIADQRLRRRGPKDHPGK